MTDASASAETWAAPRDASWRAKPGHAGRYHVKVMRRTIPVAACSDRVWLSERCQQPARDTPPVLRCQRYGCKQRWPRWESAGGQVFNGADVTKSLSVHECSLAWAEHILAEYDLEDWDWLIHSLAETMDEEALSAADHWLADHKAELENAAQWPRWCPCGRWPDFGTACWYHGPCKCMERGERGWLKVAYGGFDWDADWEKYAGRGQPKLDCGCPVHPDGPIPRFVLARVQRSYNSVSPRLFGERGLNDDELAEKLGGEDD